MFNARKTTYRQRILDMYANNFLNQRAAVDLDRASTARPGVYDGVGTWFGNTYHPAHGDLTAEKFEEESNGFFSEADAMQTDEGSACNNNGKRLLAQTLGKGKEKEEPQRKRKRGFYASREDPLLDVPEVRPESGRRPWEAEAFAPADCGVHSCTGETQGGNPMELRYYFTNFDF